MHAEQQGPSRVSGRWWGALVAFFALAHAFYWTLGLRFDSRALIEYIHYLDPSWLRDNLLQSLWFLHIQPPLFNAFAGIVLKAGGHDYMFQACYLLAGFTLYACAFLLPLRLGAPRWLALAVATLLMASPAFMTFEHMLIYTLPCATALALACLLLFDVIDRQSWPAVLGFFACLAFLALTRTTFHLGWLILVWLAVTAACKTHRRRVFIAGLVPVLLVAGWYGKNAWLFGDFSACTFTGKNLWVMTAGNMNPEERAQWVASGRLDPVSAQNRWAELEAFDPAYRKVPVRFAHVPMLANTRQPNGAVNYNHFGYIAQSRVFGKDARYVLFHRPKAYAAAVALSAYRYFLPATCRPLTLENQERIAPATKAFDYIVLGRLPFGGKALERLGGPPHIWLSLALLAAPLAGLWLLFRSSLYWPGKCAVAFMLFHIMMVAALGCALDFTDGSRYRFVTNPFTLALLAAAAAPVMARCSASRRNEDS